jgi:hypothetical protein
LTQLEFPEGEQQAPQARYVNYVGWFGASRDP